MQKDDLHKTINPPTLLSSIQHETWEYIDFRRRMLHQKYGKSRLSFKELLKEIDLCESTVSKKFGGKDAIPENIIIEKKIIPDWTHFRSSRKWDIDVVAAWLVDPDMQFNVSRSFKDEVYLRCKELEEKFGKSKISVEEMANEIGSSKSIVTKMFGGKDAIPEKTIIAEKRLPAWTNHSGKRQWDILELAKWLVQTKKRKYLK